MPDSAAEIAVVGVGPRGTVMLERICANAPLLAPGRPIDVHLIDPCAPGGGRVWRADQNRHVVMNTVAGDITVFTDDSVRCAGTIRPGPTQYHFARMLAAGEIGGPPGWAVAEARTMRPWSYATRAFQGCYLGWALRHIIDTAPPQVRVISHRVRAVALDDAAAGRQLLWLDGNPVPLEVDSVVLSMGHIDVAPTSGQRELADFADRCGAVYLPPASPNEVDLGGVGAGQPVIMRGLGLNFFDYMVLLTVGRGGAFNRRSGRLVYRPSGQEPVMYAGSGRGVPYTARAEIRQEVVPRYQPTFLTADVIRGLRRAAGTGRGDFMADLWPYVAKEAGWVFYRHLLRDDPAALARFEASYPALAWGSRELDALLEALVPDAGLRWDWDRLDRPAAGQLFAGRQAYGAWVTGLLRDDYVSSTLGPAGSALKATAAMLRDLRDEVRQVISHQGLSGTSYRDHIDRWFSGLNNYVASGPPAFRIEELAALAEAGVVRFVGPGMRVTTDQERGLFLAHSPAVDEPPLAATALIEAHLPLIDLRRTTDPLLRHLLDGRQCRPHRIPNADGTDVETGGLDIAEGSHRVIDADGTAHRGRFSYGPPVESVQWVTAIGARPHVNSRTLLQGDVIARGALATALENLSRQAATVSMAGESLYLPAGIGNLPTIRYNRLMSSRERLIEAAAELLWERGYSATSPAMIQERAGAGKGSMYHYFDGKADLAATATRQTSSRMRQEILEATAGRASALGTLYAYLDAERQPLRGCRLGRLVQDPEVVAEEALRGSIGEFFSWQRSWAAGVLADGQLTGELRADFDPEQIAALLVASVQGAYVLARAEQDAVVHEMAIEGMKRVLAGLAARDTAGTVP